MSRRGFGKVTTLDEVRIYCLAKPGTRETYPFDEGVLVVKVVTKMFALANTDGLPTSLSLKCEPELAVLLREKYEAITPGYHLNKRHWNTLRLDGSLPDEEVRELIDLCYRLVVGGLKGQSAKR